MSGEYVAGLFADELARKYEKMPDFPVITFENGEGLADEVVTYADLFRGGCKVAAALMKAGICTAIASVSTQSTMKLGSMSQSWVNEAQNADAIRRKTTSLAFISSTNVVRTTFIALPAGFLPHRLSR